MCIYLMHTEKSPNLYGVHSNEIVYAFVLNRVHREIKSLYKNNNPIGYCVVWSYNRAHQFLVEQRFPPDYSWFFFHSNCRRDSKYWNKRTSHAHLTSNASAAGDRQMIIYWLTDWLCVSGLYPADEIFIWSSLLCKAGFVRPLVRVRWKNNINGKICTIGINKMLYYHWPYIWYNWCLIGRWAENMHLDTHSIVCTGIVAAIGVAVHLVLKYKQLNWLGFTCPASF